MVGHFFVGTGWGPSVGVGSNLTVVCGEEPPYGLWVELRSSLLQGYIWKYI